MNVPLSESALLVHTDFSDVRRQSFPLSRKTAALLLALALPLTIKAQTGQPPTVTVDPASQVSGASALITGTVNPNGLPTVWHVLYGTNTDYYTSVAGVVPAQATPISIAVDLYWLINPRTTYHYQLVATNSAGQGSSPDMSFTTGGPNVPSVYLNGPVQITTSNAAVSGAINPNGLFTSFALFWGANTAYDHHDGWVSLPAQNTSVPVGGSMFGLSPATIYHYQLVSSNSDGYGYSADMTLTTPALPPPVLAPTVVTGSASSITDISAYLTGTVNPDGASANYAFLWGTTTAYGNSTVFPSPPLNYGPQNVGSLVSGLSPATTYHYQLTATNSTGMGLGVDQTFTTLSAVSAIQVSAGTFSILHDFSSSEGASSAARLTLSGNTLYGTTAGAVFKVNTDGTSFTPVHLFNDPGGGNGPTSLVLAGSTLYGTTAGGFASVNFYGTAFAVQTDGTGYTNLHNFSWGDGAGPQGSMVLSGNTLYGTAYRGGPWTNGTLFAINTDGTGFTNPHFFQSRATATDASFPRGGVILSSNTLYGTAERGGEWDGGVVFAMNTDGTSYTNLHSFRWYPNALTNEDGFSPECDLILSGDTLYGTTYWGGSFGGGSVFKVNTDGTSFTNLHSFQWTDYPTSPPMPPITNWDGGRPSSGLVLVGDTLFGTADKGGLYANGTVFALKTDGTSFTVLHSFTGGSDGAHPLAGLVASGNALYGTASAGGSYGNGTLFTIAFAPQLTIGAQETGVVVTWPKNFMGFDYSGFVLQSATNLASGMWTTNLPEPVVTNGRKIVPNPISGKEQFFRLRQ